MDFQKAGCRVIAAHKKDEKGIANNKTLVAQLYGEFLQYNAVECFVS